MAAVENEGCDAVYHLGDAIAIGPHPRECLDLLLATPGMHLVRGNHETYLVDGIPNPRPRWISDGEVVHQAWVKEQLGPDLREEVSTWPYLIDEEFAGVRVRFLHYALEPAGQDFLPMLRNPSAAELDALFEPHDAQLVFYGHDHSFADRQGETRFIDPGSLGCQKEAIAPFTVVEFGRGKFDVEHHAVRYDDRQLYQDFERRGVPDRDFLYRAFFGGRFSRR